MRILIACEYSGIVRDAFLAKGHDAWSCDILPTESPGPHYQCDVLTILDKNWDMMIAHPPCTHLSSSGAKHFPQKIKDGRQKAALNFVKRLFECVIPKIAIENPVGIISTIIRKPDQIIQPWQFGDMAQKTTCLWLHNLPKLTPTKIVDKGEFYISPSGKKLPKWYCDGGKDRQKNRSKTFPGIARAMADQWGWK